MGKVDFSSPVKTVQASISEVFSFISDLNNFEKLMPEQVINWISTADECSFDIKNMAHINLGIDEKVPDKSVLISSREGTPIEFQLICTIKETSDSKTSALIKLEANLNMMLKMMASGPLQNLVNIMSDRLVEEFEK